MKYTALTTARLVLPFTLEALRLRTMPMELKVHDACLCQGLVAFEWLELKVMSYYPRRCNQSP